MVCLGGTKNKYSRGHHRNKTSQTRRTLFDGKTEGRMRLKPVKTGRESVRAVSTQRRQRIRCDTPKLATKVQDRSNDAFLSRTVQALLMSRATRLPPEPLTCRAEFSGGPNPYLYRKKKISDRETSGMKARTRQDPSTRLLYVKNAACLHVRAH